MRIKFTFLLIMIAGSVKAQVTVPELVTDRPDQTESSSVVPLKSLQVETGFVLENKNNDHNKIKSYAYNTTLLRYGLLSNLELRLGLEYLGNKIKNISSGTEENYSGLSPLHAGFKVNISAEKGWMPEIAFMGAMELPFTANEFYRPSYPAANMRFAFSHTLSDRLELGYNLGVEWDGDSAVPDYFYSIALGAAITDKLGMFLEAYGLIQEENEGEHLLDMGFTYLITPNLQFDISGGIGLNNQTIDNFLSAGLTVRLPH